MNRRDFLTATASAAAAAALIPGTAALAVKAGKAGKNVKVAAMVVYPEFTALDLVGPLQVFALLPGMDVKIVGKTRDPVTTDSGMTIVPTWGFDDCPQDVSILFVPGGTRGTVAAMQDKETLDFLANRGKTAEFVTSVCTGSLILGAAGLLKGYKATTHWVAREILAKLGAEPVAARVVSDRNRITGAGVTAGIDFGLDMAVRLKGEDRAKAVQLAMEYDPQPPIKAGSPEQAGEAITGKMRESFGPFVKTATAAAERAAASWNA